MSDDERTGGVIVFPTHVRVAKINSDLVAASMKAGVRSAPKPARRIKIARPAKAVKKPARAPKVKAAPLSAAERDVARRIAKGANTFRPGPQKPGQREKPEGQWEFGPDDFAAAMAAWDGKPERAEGA